MTHNPGMGLLHRFFGTEKDKSGSGSGPASTHFHESGDDDSDNPGGSRNAPRRELVQVVLRDTMRKHGIPSDWIDLRILSTVNRHGRPGLHVCFVVKQAHDRMLGHLFSFQDSFQTELAQFEPRAADWLLTVAWQFENYGATRLAQAGGSALAALAAAAPAQGAHGGPRELPPLEPPPSATAAPAPAPAADEDVQRDLAALFAIRDQALAEAAARRAAEAGATAADAGIGIGFEPTRPGFEDSSDPQHER